MTFRYNGGGCEQSNNLQPRQKFSCTDSNGGPPPMGSSATSYITATPRGGSENYFSGTVAVSDKFVLNEDRQFDRLAADMTITIFDQEGGLALQTVDLHLSCSQPLFLFDKFGASQVTEWTEVSGRQVSDTQTDVRTENITVSLDATADATAVRLLEMTVLSNTEGTFDYTPFVENRILEPGASLDLPGLNVTIELGTQTRYTFFTTIVGETLDGTNMCNGNDLLECTVGFNLNPSFPTAVPTPSPTTTPFPTALVGPCEIDSLIGCVVTQPNFGDLSCADLGAPVPTCPANADLLRAYMQYDGSSGESVYVEIVCNEDSIYLSQQVLAGEVIEFNTRANTEVCPEAIATVYNSNPALGGSEITGAEIPIACPGPWTLGATIIPGFTLVSYVSTTDNGLSFDYNANSVEVELTFIGGNPGNTELTITSGTFDSPFGSGAVTGLPTNVPPRSQQTLATQSGTIQLAGQSGQTVSVSQILQGDTTNAPGNTCTGGGQIEVTL